VIRETKVFPVRKVIRETKDRKEIEVPLVVLKVIRETKDRKEIEVPLVVLKETQALEAQQVHQAHEV
jgi:hypothetical protein